MNPKTRYIRTARVNKLKYKTVYNNLTGFTDCIEDGYYTIIESVTFDNLVDAQKKLDNEVEFLYIEVVKLLISADMNRNVAKALGIPKEDFGDCI
jgi:hypothetical protein